MLKPVFGKFSSKGHYTIYVDAGGAPIVRHMGDSDIMVSMAYLHEDAPFEWGADIHEIAWTEGTQERRIFIKVCPPA